ncbi:MAG: bacillithiol biosynthesis cysteine-adding enzyme BshC [Planctomycetota bacterium]
MRTESLPWDVLEVSGIARSLLTRPDAVSGLVIPRELAQIPEPRERFSREERAELADALEHHLSPLAPHVAVLDAVRGLRQPGTCAVIAGQQPGFLASPLYNIHKALHVVRLARALTQAWERPVVAMFWNHADDHDLAEVNHAFVPNDNFDLQRVGLSGMASGRQPFSRVVLSEDKHRLASIRATLGELHRLDPHIEEALDLFCPRDGETLARAFTRSMTDLLGSHGLVVLEPDWIRSPLSRSLGEIVGRSGEGGLERALKHGAAQIRAIGHEPQIDPATAALLYRVDERGRSALRLGGDGFRYDGEEGSRTSAELAAEIVQDPTGWSPAALTRPIAQDASLPIAAYVGGLGELAYHAQLIALRDFAHVPRTPFVPRFSCTLIEPEVAASLGALGLDLESVLRARGVIETSSEENNPVVIEALREIAVRAARELNDKREALAQVDTGLAANLKRTGEQIRALVEKICEKAERVHQNKSGRGQRHVRRVANALFPRELPQERVIGPLPFVARHGRAWVTELLDQVPALPLEHAIAFLEARPEEEA